MTDRELLEYAAKAGGITGIKWHESGEGGWLDGCGAPSTWWNPLTDDGDALRLAVKLHLSIRYTWDGGNDEFDAVYVDGRGSICVEEQIGFFHMEQIDEKIATRRAIVRAAAKIGKAML